jgi:hypothetical protein
MASDDEILQDYERELDADRAPPRRSNRRFWLVLGAIGLVSAITLVEIFANLGIKESIAHAQFSLREAQAAAEAIETRNATFTAADADGMAEATDELAFVGPDEASNGLDEISVAAGVSEWAAAVQVRPGACFYLHIDVDVVTYGAGTICTGREGLRAVDDRW